MTKDLRYQICKVCGAKDCDCTMMDWVNKLQAKNAELTAENATLQEQVDLQIPKLAFEQLTAEVERLKKAVIDTEEMRGATIRDMEDYRQQLASAEEHNARLREFLEKLSCLGNGDRHGNSIDNCIAIEALSIPASREALDAYVAEKVKDENDQILAAKNLLAIMHRDGGHHEFAVGFDQAVQDAMAIYYELTKQRDLAVSALEKVGELMLCGKKDHLPWRCSDASKLVLKTLAKIKESEA